MCVELLIQRKANVNVSEKGTPYDCPLVYVTSVLKNNDVFIFPSLSLSLSRAHSFSLYISLSLSLSLYLLRIRVTQTKTLRGFTPLHFTYQQHCEDIIKILKNAKADVTAKSALGQAPGGKGSGLGSELEIVRPFYGETTKGKKSSIPP